MKVLEIESQICETHIEALLLNELIKMAKEAGYTHVHDNWAYRAYDEYTIDEAIEKFKPNKPDTSYIDSTTTTAKNSAPLGNIETNFQEDAINEIEQEYWDEEYHNLYREIGRRMIKEDDDLPF